MTEKAVRSLALFAALGVLFDLTHGAMDQWFQRGCDAVGKDKYGTNRVHHDGSPAEDGEDGTVSASTFGRRSAASHVAGYTTGQVLVTVAVTRALGVRVPPAALLTGAAINASTHYLLDRRRPLRWLAGKIGRTTYLDACPVMRTPSGEPDEKGPGTALFELDQAANRFIGLFAAAATTVLTVRSWGRH